MPDNLNLVPERGPSVWARPRQASRERVQAGGAVSGALMLAAGAAAAFFGGRMLYRAVQGATRRSADEPAEHADIVDQESAQSFPASDSPSWTVSEGATVEKRRSR